MVYSVGTKVQVMVYQPKFYYNVVPLKLDEVAGGKGYHLRKAQYFLSSVKKTGLKLHPAFIKNGAEKDYILIGAYEGSLYDVSTSSYLVNNEQVADFTVAAGDKLSSIANAKPISGTTQNLTRRNGGILAENRGAG